MSLSLYVQTLVYRHKYAFILFFRHYVRRKLYHIHANTLKSYFTQVKYNWY